MCSLSLRQPTALDVFTIDEPCINLDALLSVSACVSHAPCLDPGSITRYVMHGSVTVLVLFDQFHD
jgi:hypothetical protein